MKFSYRLLASWLIVTIMVPVCLTATIANNGIRSVLGQINMVNALLDSSQPLLPNRPYMTEDQLYSEMGPLTRYLASHEVSCKTFLNEQGLKDMVLNARSIEELVSTKAELEALKKLQNEAGKQIEKFRSAGTGYGNGMAIGDLEALSANLDRLLTPALTLYQPDLDSAMKGTWTHENKVLLKWTPVDGWIPEEGYDLFRVINGNAMLVGEGLGSPERTEQLLSDNPDCADFIEIFKAATLDDEKKAVLGVQSEAEFHAMAYANAHSYDSYLRIKGNISFQLQKNALIAIPSGIEAKMPQADAFMNADVHFKDEIHADATPYQEFIGSQGILPVAPILPSHMPPLLSDKERVRNGLLEARKALLTKAFVDSRFADDIGFGYEDVFGETRYATHTPVQYIVVPVNGPADEISLTQIASGEEIEGSFSITVPYGVEMPLAAPEGFAGYGADQKVSLRWDAPTDSIQKRIISGYYVERRRKEQTLFVQANELPVAVTYSQDIEGFLCEASATFEDLNVLNNDEFVYRVQAVDILGRKSPYTPELEVKVHKVAPPQTPSLQDPTIPRKITTRTPESHQNLFAVNSGNDGVILPISSNSADTSVFIVYRSKAYGKSQFGPPEELVRINYAPFAAVDEQVYSYTPTGGIFAIQGIHPTEPGTVVNSPDILYFDSEVEPGYYYKYWVSAVDDYGNESEWSASQTAGLSSDLMPQIPVNPVAEMRHNQTVGDRETSPPGFYSRYVTKDAQNTMGLEVNMQVDTSTVDGEGAQDGATPEYSSPGASAAGMGFLPETSAQMGISLSDSIRQDTPALPTLLSAQDDNLPYPNDILDIIALTDEDLEADGTAKFNWYHYQGTGLKGYTVYRAYADGLSRQALQNMSEAELLESFDWTLRANNTTVNEWTDRVERRTGRTYLYLVCLIPDRPSTQYLEALDVYLPAGWVRVGWERPDDPQVSYFRVYRAEVLRFDDNQDLSALNWHMVSDNTKTTVYSEKVDQTDAHYYLYKITSVSIWGIESEEGAVVRYRVPSTVAPQAPTLLVPFSRKGINEINWLGVPHATRYVVYRVMVPRVDAGDLQDMGDSFPNLFDKMFAVDRYRSVYRPDEAITNPVNNQVRPGGALPAIQSLAAAAGFYPAAGGISQASDDKPTANMISRFKTSETDSSAFLSGISGISMADKSSLVQGIADKYGVLAITAYSSLDEELAGTVAWQEIGEVVVPPGEDPTGNKVFLDHTAQFGETYYYTVQAKNDDSLGSDRPEPVTLFTRQGEPFSPVTITNWTNDAGRPRIYWEGPRHPKLTPVQCQRLVAGYLVYRSNREDGPYYQVSPLIEWNTPYFTDMNARVGEENWYRVKVLNTAGFISDFSEPIQATDTSNTLPEGMFTQVIGLGAEGAETPAGTHLPATASRPLKHTAGRLDPSPTPPILRTPEPSPTIIPIPTPSVIPIPTPTPSIIPIPTPSVIPIPITPTPTPPGADTATPTPTPSAPGSDTGIPTPTPATPTPSTPTPSAPPFGPASPTPSAPPFGPATPTAPSVGPASPTPKPEIVIKDTLYINDFVIKNVTAETWGTGKGTGNLMLLDYPVSVSINAIEFSGDRITRGSVTMTSSSVLGDTGVHLINLSVSTSNHTGARVSGFVRKSDRSLMGDLDTLYFTDSLLTSDGFVEITQIPVFHYQNLTFRSVEKIRVDFGKLNRNGMVMPYLTLFSGMAENSLGLEYVNATITMHRGIQYTFDMIAFNKNGQLNGSFRLDGTQQMRLVVPAGLCIKVTRSSLDYRRGQVNTSASYIEGRVLTQYGKWTDDESIDDSQEEDTQNHTLGLDDIAALSVSADASNQALADSALYFIAQEAQSNSLLLFPDHLAYEETVSSLPFSITAWDGGGFMVEETDMTPVNIPLFDPSKLTQQEQEEQRNAMLGITPNKVSLDLSRSQVYNGTAPADTKDPAWMGIVVKRGSVSLPPSYVKAEDGKRIRFNLAPGELLYDLNGFCYQNQAYSPEGRPADLGEDLGGFKNLLVKNIVIDLYANYADLLVEADLGIDLFQRYVQVQMLRDDHSDKFVCNVLESDPFDVVGDGKLNIQISNGYLDSKGIHLDGILNMNIAEGEEKSFAVTNAGFNDLIIPPPPTTSSGHFQSRGAYDFESTVMLTKPYLVKFHDFPLEIRSFQLTARPLLDNEPQPHQTEYEGMRYNADLTFFGGMQLADSMKMNTDEDLDRIRFTGVFNAPAVSYDSCQTQLEMVFEDFTEVKGVGKPVQPPADCDTGAFIEYDTSAMEMLFSPSSALSFDSSFEVKARFGYDKIRERCYFAVASYYKGTGIPFGYGEIFNMAGMFAYNMEMDKNDDGTFIIPKEEDALFAIIPDMDPDESAGGNFIFVAACDMTMRYNGFKFGEMKNMYLLVEKGPSVEIGAQFWAATDIDSIIAQTDFEPIGEAKIGYYSSRKMFKFSLTLFGTSICGMSVSGVMSFEMCPDYWYLYIGYPDYMSAKMGPLFADLSLGIRNSDVDESFFIVKARTGFDTGEVTIAIVYFHGYLEIGGEGGISDSCMWLSAYVRGGISGGVEALGEKFEVISLMLDAGGQLVKHKGKGWNLDAHACLSYHVDLVLDDIDGSVNWHINKDL